MTDVVFFFFNDTATTEIYTLSLPDALPIFESEFPQPQREQILNPLGSGIIVTVNQVQHTPAMFCARRRRKG